ncbi:MAG TPA: PIG-L deacetylase family protein [Flavobacteriales bacterium]|nr:PIG-L deacetylase family protein [Flavobacteriales bacterium]
MSKNRILVLAPHTDDGELGCGATIAEYIDKGKEVFYVAFSICSRSLPEGWAPDTLAKEVAKATKVLGVKPENLILFDFDVRKFPEFRQEILEEMVKLKRNINPDLVYVPSPTDIHQDHQVISQEGLRAFKNVSILGYEMPWNNISFNTRAFNILEEKYIQKKIDCLQMYKTQKHRTYLNDNFIRSLATTRGVQIGAPYAEAFEVIRWII